jgi:transcriptional regulator with XRE-family HTH domain
MEIEVQTQPLTFSSSETEKDIGKVKTPHRMQYEAQVEVIRRQTGDLEKIREKLGLSQRKIAQLLMVDPSAWTRWTKKGEPTPPHIYRALQWYLILNEKIPGLTPQYFIGKDPEVLHQTALQHIQVESQKRLEFEDAVSIQALRLESQVQDLLKLNGLLNQAKSNLETEVTALRKAVYFNRVGFFLLAFSGLLLSVSFYWNFLK